MHVDLGTGVRGLALGAQEDLFSVFALPPCLTDQPCNTETNGESHLYTCPWLVCMGLRCPSLTARAAWGWKSVPLGRRVRVAEDPVALVLRCHVEILRLAIEPRSPYICTSNRDHRVVTPRTAAAKASDSKGNGGDSLYNHGMRQAPHASGKNLDGRLHCTSRVDKQA